MNCIRNDPHHAPTLDQPNSLILNPNLLDRLLEGGRTPSDRSRDTSALKSPYQKLSVLSFWGFLFSLPLAWSSSHAGYCWRQGGGLERRLFGAEQYVVMVNSRLSALLNRLPMRPFGRPSPRFTLVPYARTMSAVSLTIRIILGDIGIRNRRFPSTLEVTMPLTLLRS
jgi:hypothetical protein